MIQNEELYLKLKDLITADWDPGTKLNKKHFKLRSTMLSQIYGKQLNDKVEAKFWINSEDKPNRLDFELRGGDDKYATAKMDIVEFLREHFVDGDKPDVLEGLSRNKNCNTKVAHIDLPTDLERRVEIIRACIKYFDQKIKEINKDYYGVINYSGNADEDLQEKKTTVEINHTPKAIDFNSGEEEPGTSKQEIYRVLRDSTLARQIKLLHGNCCQICSTTMKLQGNKLYSEAHHIIPLGKPHNGPDTADNLIVLCPNCHVLCDYGANSLDLSNITQVGNHQVSQKSIDYHNTKIVGSNL
jgi:predicted HNH restriction endonuclease